MSEALSMKNDPRYDATREIRAPRGTQLSCKSWVTEAAYRMIQNNLDAEVAENPKPLDVNAFNTLVKTASEFIRRSEQQLHAELHQRITVAAGAGRVTVSLDIVPDEENPYATLSAVDEFGDSMAEVRVAPNFKLNRASATAWVEGGCAKPKER